MAERDEFATEPEARIETIEATFRKEASGLARYFQARLRGAGDPVDFVQEVFARLLSRSKKGAMDNPAAFMNRIARNLLIDHSRHHKLRIDHEGPMEPNLDLSIPATQFQQVEASQMMDRFRHSVDRLSPRTREVFLLHHVDEFPYKAIAQRLEISVRTVEWHMAEALLRIRRMMDE